MHAITHLIHMKKDSDVRESSMRVVDLHMERTVAAHHGSQNGGAVAEVGAGGVLSAREAEARVFGDAAVGRGHPGGVGFGLIFDAEARN